MLIDWTIYGLLTWGVVALLNATAFTQKPASRATAWVLTIVVFFVNLVAMTALQIFRYKMISQDMGIDIRPKSPFDFVGAFTFSWVFFGLLRKVPKSQSKDKREESSHIATSASSEPALPTCRPARPVVDKPTQQVAGSAGSSNAQIRLAASETADVPPEQFWAAAIADFDGSSRRPGLWARAFAEAQGNELAAKANYLRYRAAELQQEHAAGLERERLNAEAAQRAAALAHLSAEQRMYADLPKGVCPNCDAIVPLNHVTCSGCKAMFGPNSVWNLRPIDEKEHIALLRVAYLSGKEPTADDIILLSRASSHDKSLAELSDRLRAETLLHWAARHGLQSEALLLMANGAKPDAPNGNGRKPHQLAEEVELQSILRAAAEANEI